MVVFASAQCSSLKKDEWVRMYCKMVGAKHVAWLSYICGKHILQVISCSAYKVSLVGIDSN